QRGDKMREHASTSFHLLSVGTVSKFPVARAEPRAKRFLVTWLGVIVVVLAAVAPVTITSASATTSHDQISQSTLTSRPTSHDVTTYSVGTTDSSQPSEIGRASC